MAVRWTATIVGCTSAGTSDVLAGGFWYHKPVETICTINDFQNKQFSLFLLYIQGIYLLKNSTPYNNFRFILGTIYSIGVDS